MNSKTLSFALVLAVPALLQANDFQSGLHDGQQPDPAPPAVGDSGPAHDPGSGGTVLQHPRHHQLSAALCAAYQAEDTAYKADITSLENQVKIFMDDKEKQKMAIKQLEAQRDTIQQQLLNIMKTCNTGQGACANPAPLKAQIAVINAQIHSDRALKRADEQVMDSLRRAEDPFKTLDKSVQNKLKKCSAPAAGASGQGSGTPEQGTTSHSGSGGNSQP